MNAFIIIEDNINTSNILNISTSLFCAKEEKEKLEKKNPKKRYHILEIPIINIY